MSHSLNFTPLILFLIAVAVTFAVSNNNVLAGAMLQSPVSPAGQPPQPDTPAEAQPAPAQPNPQQAAPQPQTDGAAIESVSPVSPVQPAAVQSADLETPPELLPPPLPAPRQSQQDDSLYFDEEPPNDQSLILDQAELIDTVVVSTAYVWLCCGIVLILLIPLIFLFLQIRGRSKILKEEQF